ncbi:hypothetical protein DFH07DRAFT_684547, partial [Mycena maculata]
MTLKSYLEMDPAKRAAWAHMADKLLPKRDKPSSNVKKGSHVNPFLQTWKPKANGKLPEFLKGMLKVAAKYGIEFNTLQPSQAIRESLPLWHHLGEDASHTQFNNTATCQCLRSTHGVSTVGEGMAIMARLVCQSHVEDRWCVCAPCSSDRLKGCKNPHACALLVKTRLDRLLSKWDPRRPDPPVVTPAPPGEEGARLFVPPPEIATLTDGFRIFTKPTAAPTDAPPATPPAPLPATVSPVQVAIGSHYKLLGTMDAGAAFGVHFGQDDPRNVSSVIPEQKSLTRGCAEAIATLVAARSTPVTAPLRI